MGTEVHFKMFSSRDREVSLWFFFLGHTGCLGWGPCQLQVKYLHGNSSLSRPKTQPAACNTAYPTSSNVGGGGWHAQANRNTKGSLYTPLPLVLSGSQNWAGTLCSHCVVPVATPPVSSVFGTFKAVLALTRSVWQSRQADL